MNSNTVAHPDSPSQPAILSRRVTRRRLVLGWAICCLALLTLGIFEVKGVIWFLLIALTVTVDTLLYLATRRVTDRPTSSLDERERTVRNRAYRTSYLAVFYGITVVVAGAMLLFYTGQELASRWLAHPASHPAFLSGLGIATLQLVALLPTAIVAWSELDEPGEID